MDSFSPKRACHHAWNHSVSSGVGVNEKTGSIAGGVSLSVRTAKPLPYPALLVSCWATSVACSHRSRLLPFGSSRSVPPEETAVYFRRKCKTTSFHLPLPSRARKADGAWPCNDAQRWLALFCCPATLACDGQGGSLLYTAPSRSLTRFVCVAFEKGATTMPDLRSSGLSGSVTFTRTMDDVQDLVCEDDKGKWDSIARVQEVSLCKGRLYFPQATADGYDTGLAFSPWAMGQACQKLGMPTAYFKRCPPALQDAQFNHWANMAHIGREFRRADEQPEEAWTLRCKGGSVRGVLSQRYGKLDNAQLLQALLPVLKGTRYQVGLIQLTDESFHLRLIEPTVGRDVLPQDRLLVGVHIANSEVGLRAVTVDAVVFRLVCTNGLVRRVNHKSLLHQRHIHVSEPRFQSLLERAVGEAITVAAGFIEQMVLATRTPVPDPMAAVEVLGQAWGLPKATVEQVQFALHGEGTGQHHTLYNLTNAITLTAQRLGPDERFHLETLAGLLVDTTANGMGERQLRSRVLSPKPMAVGTERGVKALARQAAFATALNVGN